MLEIIIGTITVFIMLCIIYLILILVINIDNKKMINYLPSHKLDKVYDKLDEEGIAELKRIVRIKYRWYIMKYTNLLDMDFGHMVNHIIEEVGFFTYYNIKDKDVTHIIHSTIVELYTDDILVRFTINKK